MNVCKRCREFYRNGLRGRWEGGVLDGGGVVEHFLIYVVCPVGGKGCDKEGLDFDESADEIGVQPNGGGGFTVGVARSLELVETCFEGKFVGCARRELVS